MFPTHWINRGEKSLFWREITRHAKESTELCPKRRRKEQQKENTRGREQNDHTHTHTHTPPYVSSRVKLPQSRGKGREEEHAKEKKKKNTRIISRDDSSSSSSERRALMRKKAEREREREREKRTEKQQSSLWFSSFFEKKFHLFSCKNFVCCLERHTHTNQKSLPNLHRATRVPRIVLFEHVTS